MAQKVVDDSVEKVRYKRANTLYALKAAIKSCLHARPYFLNGVTMRTRLSTIVLPRPFADGIKINTEVPLPPWEPVIKQHFWRWA